MEAQASDDTDSSSKQSQVPTEMAEKVLQHFKIHNPASYKKLRDNRELLIEAMRMVRRHAIDHGTDWRGTFEIPKSEVHKDKSGAQDQSKTVSGKIDVGSISSDRHRPPHANSSQNANEAQAVKEDNADSNEWYLKNANYDFLADKFMQEKDIEIEEKEAVKKSMQAISPDVLRRFEERSAAAKKKEKKSVSPSASEKGRIQEDRELFEALEPELGNQQWFQDTRDGVISESSSAERQAHMLRLAEAKTEAKGISWCDESQKQE